MNNLPPLPEVPPPAPLRPASAWGCGMKLLWGYSLLILMIAIVGCLTAPLFPMPVVSPQQQAQESVIVGLFLLPVFLFLILVGIGSFRRKT